VGRKCPVSIPLVWFQFSVRDCHGARPLKLLTVLYDGEPVGRILVTSHDARRIIGRFVPGPGYPLCKAQFEEAIRIDRLCNEALDEGDYYYPGVSGYFGVIEAITRRVSLPEILQAIEEFEIADGEKVEVFLVSQQPS
jgi:hypothetical protein